MLYAFFFFPLPCSFSVIGSIPSFGLSRNSALHFPEKHVCLYESLSLFKLAAQQFL